MGHPVDIQMIKYYNTTLSPCLGTWWCAATSRTSQSPTSLRWAVQCSTVQCSTVQYSTVQYNTVTHFLKDFLHEDREDVDVEVVFLHRWGWEEGEGDHTYESCKECVLLLLGSGDPALTKINSLLPVGRYINMDPSLTELVISQTQFIRFGQIFFGWICDNLLHFPSIIAENIKLKNWSQQNFVIEIYLFFISILG